MNWAMAVDAMKSGSHVQRTCETGKKLIGHTDGIPIYQCGMESCYLAHAWTDDQRSVRVFCGSESKTLFVPDSDHMNATDWFVVN